MICPNCNEQDHFQQYDSTESDAPQLLFRCINCGKCFQATSMKHVIQDSCQERPQIQVPTGMEQTRSFQETSNTRISRINCGQDDLQTHLDTFHRLTQELEQTRAEVNNLRSQIDKLQQ